MKTQMTGLRKKIKYLSGLIREYDYLTSLINAMKKSKELGLDVPQEYLANCIKRQDKIETELNDILS